MSNTTHRRGGFKNIVPNGRQLTEGGFLANLVDAAFC